MDIFNTSISRKGTYCTQWDFCEDRFGVKDVLCNQVNHLIPTRVLVKGGEITCKILK